MTYLYLNSTFAKIDHLQWKNDWTVGTRTRDLIQKEYYDNSLSCLLSFNIGLCLQIALFETRPRHVGKIMLSPRIWTLKNFQNNLSS